MSDDKKIIFSMIGVSKSFENNNKQVLKDIYLSFLWCKNWNNWFKWVWKIYPFKKNSGIEKSFSGEITFLRDLVLGI